MILELTIINFKSIKDKQSFSMLPERKIKEHSEAVLKDGKYEALSSAIIYGRNASGKSNIINAFSAFQHLVMNSAKFEVGTKIPYYKPYKLDPKSIEKPTEFKIDFIAENKVRYIMRFPIIQILFLKKHYFITPKIK